LEGADDLTHHHGYAVAVCDAMLDLRLPNALSRLDRRFPFQPRKHALIWNDYLRLSVLLLTAAWVASSVLGQGGLLTVLTNQWAEQAMCPAVVNRKVWGGNRTWAGTQAQSILMSVIRTCGQRAVEPFAFLLEVLCRPQPQLTGGLPAVPRSQRPNITSSHRYGCATALPSQ